MNAAPAPSALGKGLRGAEVVLVVAGTSWDGIWYSERHLARHLSRRMPVLWVDPQISLLSPLRDRRAASALREPRLRIVAPNILRLSPVTVPGVSRPLLRDVAQRQARRAVRSAVDRLRVRVHTTIVASLNEMLDVVPCGRRVFYGTDDFAAGARLMGTDPGWLARSTRRQLALADLVIALSEPLRRRWAPLCSRIEVVPNGCDFDRLSQADDVPAPTDVDLPPPVAGFVGQMSDRIDLEMLEAVAATGASLLLVGPRQPSFEIGKLDALLARENVQWVGPKRFEELPAYLGAIDVGLTPYSGSTFNDASFPMKTLDYMAAGRPVVGTDLPAHRWLDTPYLEIVETPAEFARSALRLLAAPRAAADVEGCRAVAERNSWAARSEEIATLIGLGTRAETEPVALP